MASIPEGRGLLNRFAAGLGVPLDLPVAWAGADALAWWQGAGSDGLLWLGVLWSAAIAWAVAARMTGGGTRALKALLPHLILMAGSTWGVMAGLG